MTATPETMEYDGLLVQQVSNGPEIILMAAPAIDISIWAGVPQRRRIGTDGAVESAGFQREEKRARVNEIARFMQEPANLIQNPLLAAIQNPDKVEIIRTGGQNCKVRIHSESTEKTLRELLADVRNELVRRMPELAGRQINATIMQEIRSDLSIDATSSAEYSTIEVDENADQDSDDLPEPGADENIESALFQEETQVVDFYDEIAARLAAVEELGPDAAQLDDIAGFGKEFLTEFARPVVIVDGQHRLRGALQAISDHYLTVEGEEEIAGLIDQGFSPSHAELVAARSGGRTLPVSLLVSPSPAEHVFQFVVVNQKATPMSNALLGTIVSTSLTRQELEPIAKRLSDAGIQLESSRAVAYLTRAPESPFRGLVATGISGDSTRPLPWSVLLQLAKTIRELSGGAYFHLPGVKNADLWRRDFFPSTGLIPPEVPADERLKYWSSVDGPWRTFFIRLHTRIRSTFGDSNDMAAWNSWGNTARSNLFNKVSLSILTADFFAFLRERNNHLDDWAALDIALDEWLKELNAAYFNRDFRMGGTKKDQPRIREAWSQAWHEYRQTRDRLPRIERYNPGGSRG